MKTWRGREIKTWEFRGEWFAQVEGARYMMPGISRNSEEEAVSELIQMLQFLSRFFEGTNSDE